jgi:hypothetical protein
MVVRCHNIHGIAEMRTESNCKQGKESYYLSPAAGLTGSEPKPALTIRLSCISKQTTDDLTCKPIDKKKLHLESQKIITMKYNENPHSRIIVVLNHWLPQQNPGRDHI